MNVRQILLAGIFLVAVISLSTPLVLAHPHSGVVLIDGHEHEPHTEIIPLSGVMALEKSTVLFHAPESNTLPWGFVEGTISDHVDGYPVIIQIFRNNDAIHFAQTDVEHDGSYEYKFRVLNSENGHATKLFEGDYLVKIFKVVYANQDDIV